MPNNIDDLQNSLRVIATTANKLKDIPIQNSSLIFIQDKQRIAFDYNDKRVFYNQITVLETEYDRQTLQTPVDEQFYFVIETAIMWMYSDKWIQVSSTPQDILFIGTQLPELGVPSTLYVDKTDKSISVWDDNKYTCVGRDPVPISDDEIHALFS